MLMDDPKVWEKRIEALTKAIKETCEFADDIMDERTTQLENFFGDENPRTLLERDPSTWATCEFETKWDVHNFLFEAWQVYECSKILHELESFSGSAFDFFLEGYYKTNALPISKKTPRQFVMRTILNQVSYDLNILQDVFNQRRRRNSIATEQSRSIFLADRLSQKALQPAIDAKFVPENTNVISFLGQQIRSRLVPYYNVVLLSIAYASLQDGSYPTRDYLAIPHEIGHHVFWNGKIGEKWMRKHLIAELRKIKVYKRNWRMRWLEEIFSDAYALLVGGPVVTLDFQDMLDDDVPDHFRSDTDKHPIPEIRSMIQTEILRRITDKQGNKLYLHSPDLLDTNWQEWLKNDQLGQTEYLGKKLSSMPAEDVLGNMYKIKGKRGWMSGADILKELSGLIDLVLDTLKEMRPENREDTWSLDIASLDELPILYEMFSVLANPQKEEDDAVAMILDLDDFENILNEKGLDGLTPEEMARFTKYMMMLEQEGKPFRDRMQELIGDANLEGVESQTWIQRFLFQGWSTEGPMGSTGRG